MNIVLIGFKSCGKTTIGAMLAQAKSMDFVDTDTLLEERYYRNNGKHLTCREIYSSLGSEAMRGLETEALSEVVSKDNMVVATGGGVVLNPANLPLLRQSGICVFLDTPLSVLEKRLEAHRNSPLFASKSVSELYKERYQLYLESAHVRLSLHENEGPEQIVNDLNMLILERNHGQQ